MSLLQTFKCTFPLLSKYTKKIFKYLQWLARKYHAAPFPCLERIAQACGCSIRQVNRCLIKLEELGWLQRRRRAYHSNVYFIEDEIKGIDLDDPMVFKKIVEPTKYYEELDECPSKCPRIKSSNKEYIDTSSSEVSSCEIFEKEYVIECLKIKALTYQQQIVLMRQYSQKVLEETIQECKSYVKYLENNKQKANNVGAIIFSWARKLHQKYLNSG